LASAKPGGGPTALRIVLGAELRHLREKAGISREDAGYHIRGSESKISRMELGRVSFKQRDVADLLTLYGVTDPDEREPLLELVRRANEPGWWHRFGDVLPKWFEPFIGLEEASSLIRGYEVQFVPGLLQTEDYARTVILAGHEVAGFGEAERRVRLRMARQQVLQRPNPPRLWVVVEEAALLRPIGGPKVMRAQLEHLLEMIRLPNVVVQVMPLRAGAHAAETGAFVLLRFGEPALPDVVYTEQLTGAQYLDKQVDVERYHKVMDLLTVRAEPPAESARTIRRIAERF
jgi:transcriptional regulator with XRE-family HTH domain